MLSLIGFNKIKCSSHYIFTLIFVLLKQMTFWCSSVFFCSPCHFNILISFSTCLFLTFIQEQGCDSEPVRCMAKSMVNDYCQLFPGVIPTFHALPSISPLFACNFIAAVTSLYPCNCKFSLFFIFFLHRRKNTFEVFLKARFPKQCNYILSYYYG